MRSNRRNSTAVLCEHQNLKIISYNFASLNLSKLVLLFILTLTFSVLMTLQYFDRDVMSLFDSYITQSNQQSQMDCFGFGEYILHPTSFSYQYSSLILLQL